TTSVPPGAPVNVPAPLVGTPSPLGASVGPDPVSPPAATVFFSVLLGLARAVRLAFGEVDPDGDAVTAGTDGSNDGASGTAVDGAGCAAVCFAGLPPPPSTTAAINAIASAPPARIRTTPTPLPAEPQQPSGLGRLPAAPDRDSAVVVPTPFTARRRPQPGHAPARRPGGPRPRNPGAASGGGGSAP